MLKFLPLIFAILLSVFNVQFQNEKPLQKLNIEPNIIENVPPENIVVAEADTGRKNTLRFTWDIVQHAVKYKIFYGNEEIITFTNGIEIPVNGTDEIFKIVALDFDGKMIQDRLPITSTELNPKSPRTITEFDKMNYPPIYPVYSWIASRDAAYYQIQLLRDGQVVREHFTKVFAPDENLDFYEEDPVIDDGEYFWRVRGFSNEDVAVTNWSEKNPGNSFRVTKPARFCALGDSITHGGAVSVTPSHANYSWEFYCTTPVKNLGHSGDTTEQILYRFEEDVLPFNPEVLFIFAGVNDFRTGISGSYSVENLEDIKAKCLAYGIKPVFITPLPVNIPLIIKANFIKVPPTDWRNELNYICDWVRRQENFIDIAKQLTDDTDSLRADLTTDGLHPDAPGKKIIGEAVQNWIDNYLGK